MTSMRESFRDRIVASASALSLPSSGPCAPCDEAPTPLQTHASLNLRWLGADIGALAITRQPGRGGGERGRPSLSLTHMQPEGVIPWLQLEGSLPAYFVEENLRCPDFTKPNLLEAPEPQSSVSHRSNLLATIFLV